jgi:hypothetical protein
MYSFKICQKGVFVPKSIFPDERASGLRYVNERNEKQGGFPPAAGVTVFCPILRTRSASCGPAPGPPEKRGFPVSTYSSLIRYPILPPIIAICFLDFTTMKWPDFANYARFFGNYARK